MEFLALCEIWGAIAEVDRVSSQGDRTSFSLRSSFD